MEFQEDVQDFRIISENCVPYENLAVIQKTADASSSETDEIYASPSLSPHYLRSNPLVSK